MRQLGLLLLFCSASTAQQNYPAFTLFNGERFGNGFSKALYHDNVARISFTRFDDADEFDMAFSVLHTGPDPEFGEPLRLGVRIWSQEPEASNLPPNQRGYFLADYNRAFEACDLSAKLLVPLADTSDGQRWHWGLELEELSFRLNDQFALTASAQYWSDTGAEFALGPRYRRGRFCAQYLIGSESLWSVSWSTRVPTLTLKNDASP